MVNARRLLAPKEVKVALDALDQIGKEMSNHAFDTVKSRIEDEFLKNPRPVSYEAKKGVSPYNQVCFAMANLAGDLLESGEYHMHRGVLNPLGDGLALLDLYKFALAKLVQNRMITQAEADSNYSDLITNIKSVG